jgi:hypothetical protein
MARPEITPFEPLFFIRFPTLSKRNLSSLQRIQERRLFDTPLFGRISRLVLASIPEDRFIVVSAVVWC